MLQNCESAIESKAYTLTVATPAALVPERRNVDAAFCGYRQETCAYRFRAGVAQKDRAPRWPTSGSAHLLTGLSNWIVGARRVRVQVPPSDH